MQDYRFTTLRFTLADKPCALLTLYNAVFPTHVYGGH